MGSHVAFLRAINLGRTRRFPKDGIIRATQAAGSTDVATHIASGNVGFATRMRSRARIEEALGTAYAAEVGFEVPTIVFSAAELRDLVEYAGPPVERRRQFASLLKDEPTGAGATAIAAMSTDHEDVRVRGRAVHLCVHGADYLDARVGNAEVEKVLGIVATTRAMTVIRAVADKWCAGETTDSP